MPLLGRHRGMIMAGGSSCLRSNNKALVSFERSEKLLYVHGDLFMQQPKSVPVALGEGATASLLQTEHDLGKNLFYADLTWQDLLIVGELNQRLKSLSVLLHAVGPWVTADEVLESDPGFVLWG